MDKLERLLENVEKIANSLEILTKRTEPINLGFGDAKEEQVKEVVKPIASAQATLAANMLQMPQISVQIPTPVVPVQPQIQVPTTQKVESFTQEQIARAMANATQVGRQDIIQNIFAKFRVQTLMEIGPENYNQIATMLREAGIQV